MISAKVYAEHPQLGLIPTIRALPDAVMSVVSEAGTDPDHERYFFRIEAEDFTEVETALADDDTVAEFTCIMESETDRIYRIKYSENAKLMTSKITNIGGVTLGSERHGNGWMLELLLQNNRKLYELSEFASEEGIQLEVVEIQRTDVPPPDSFDSKLTESQREALVVAFVNGYYDEPREMYQVDLAEFLDISPTAASGRLRRGSARLIEAVLIDDDSN